MTRTLLVLLAIAIHVAREIVRPEPVVVG